MSKIFPGKKHPTRWRWCYLYHGFDLNTRPPARIYLWKCSAIPPNFFWNSYQVSSCNFFQDFSEIRRMILLVILPGLFYFRDSFIDLSRYPFRNFSWVLLKDSFTDSPEFSSMINSAVLQWISSGISSANPPGNPSAILSEIPSWIVTGFSLGFFLIEFRDSCRKFYRDSFIFIFRIP